MYNSVCEFYVILSSLKLEYQFNVNMDVSFVYKQGSVLSVFHKYEMVQLKFLNVIFEMLGKTKENQTICMAT